ASVLISGVMRVTTVPITMAIFLFFPLSFSASAAQCIGGPALPNRFDALLVMPAIVLFQGTDSKAIPPQTLSETEQASGHDWIIEFLSIIAVFSVTAVALVFIKYRRAMVNWRQADIPDQS